MDGLLNYVGMGLTGDQKLDYAQNRTLSHLQTNGVKVYLFEVFTRGQYTYGGEVKLVGEPYTKSQHGIDGNNRIIWIFPLKLV